MATKKKTTKKATSKKTVKKKADGAKPTAKKAPAKKGKPKQATTREKTAAVGVTPEDFYKMVQEAAYFQAENDGFSKDPSAYWLEAEKEIEKRLSGE